ncbi:MAG: hypothetical protein A3J83_06805 [Elusimicrobia bacterium RIFOXYA2_FULL_40_6]|nr:MAG: hypothetical protein A3J83_06805 [Elusimicrobia bacterium RIFOXYA2_FULL_40_6]
MILFSLVSSIGIVITGLVIGFLSGLFGVGGGFLMTPILRLIFLIPYNIAVGSDLAAIAITSFVGVLRHYKQSHVNFKIGLILLVGILPGVEIGAKILVWLKDSGSIDVVLNFSFLTVFIIALVIMVIELIKWIKENKTSCDLSSYKIGFHCFKKKQDVDNSINVILLIFTGLIIGILQGMLGVGGGFLLIPVLVNFFCLPARVVIGTCLFVICPSSAYGALTHIIKGNVNFILVVLILSGSIIGTTIGSTFTSKLKGKKIRFYFIFLIIIAIIMMLIKI